MFVAGIGAFSLSVMIWKVVRDDPSEKGFAPYHSSIPYNEGIGSLRGRKRSYRALFTRNPCLLSAIPGGLSGPVQAFSGLWGVPFFSTHYGLSQETSAAMTSLLLISWAVGGPVIAGFSDRIGKRKPLYLAGAAVALTGWILLVYGPMRSLPFLIALMTITGFFSGAMLVGFAFVKESVPPELIGTASGIVNTGLMMGPMILQPAIGWMLDRKWDGMITNGVRIYSIETYRAGFSLMILWTALSVVFVALTRETYCRQTAE